MKTTIVTLGIASLFVASAAFAQTATSTSPTPPTFPIAELGNCGSKEECRAYCEDATHKEACIAYAEARGLFSKAKAAAARMIIKKQGPGGCTTPQECREYCSQEANRDACYTFAVRHGLKSQDDANRARSFQNALKTTGGPGGCLDTQSCKEYCNAPEHTDECKRFAELHGFMRLRNSMGSTTDMKPRPFVGSSTKPIPPGIQDRMINASGTKPLPPGIQRPFPNAKPPKPTASTTPSTYVPQTGLGAAVANFLQFLGW